MKTVRRPVLKYHGAKWCLAEGVLFAASVFDYCRQQLIVDAARADDEG